MIAVMLFHCASCHSSSHLALPVFPLFKDAYYVGIRRTTLLPSYTRARKLVKLHLVSYLYSMDENNVFSLENLTLLQELKKVKERYFMFFIFSSVSTNTPCSFKVSRSGSQSFMRVSNSRMDIG